MSRRKVDKKEKEKEKDIVWEAFAKLKTPKYIILSYPLHAIVNSMQ